LSIDSLIDFSVCCLEICKFVYHLLQELRLCGCAQHTPNPLSHADGRCHGKRVVAYLPAESDAWTATKIRAAIDTALSLKYGNGIARMDGRHGPGKVEACAESQEVDLRQTPSHTNVDAEVVQPHKFRRLDLKPMPAGEFIELD